MMKYFEGIIEYKLSVLSSHLWYQNIFTHKKGNYISEQVLHKFGDLKEHYYRAHWFNEKIVYKVEPNVRKMFFDSSARGFFTLKKEVKQLGKEFVLGYECDVIEVIETQRKGDDQENVLYHYKQWVAPGLKLRPKYVIYEPQYFTDIEVYPIYCSVLKYQEFCDDELSRELIATDIKATRVSLRKLKTWKRFKKVDQTKQKENVRKRLEEIVSRHQKWEEERQKSVAQLKLIVGGELTTEELERPDYFLDSRKHTKKLQEILGRALTEEEQRDPQYYVELIRDQRLLAFVLDRRLTEQESADPRNVFVEILKKVSEEEAKALTGKYLQAFKEFD